MWPLPIKLPKLLERAGAGRVPGGWLFLPEEPRTWSIGTDAHILDGEEESHEAEQRGYCAIVDSQTLERIVRAVHDRLHADYFAGRLEALTYYYRYDAFLPRLGAPDPMPPEKQLQLDRQFYDLLGPERAAVRCREPGCARGAIELSVFCRVHHFLQVRGRPCPFAD